MGRNEGSGGRGNIRVVTTGGDRHVLDPRFDAMRWIERQRPDPRRMFFVLQEYFHLCVGCALSE